MRRQNEPAAAPGEHASEAGVPTGFGRYELEALLGRGGMGAVYRAHDRSTGEYVALKTLEMQTPRSIGLFEREYRTLATISHPTVVRTFDYGLSSSGFRFYTMELIEGDDLHALAPMAWRSLCAHLRDVAEALSLLHRRGLVHRDVSPRNIRIGKDGHARLLDFGALASHGVSKEIVGTPACIAPEALQQLELDGRSDLFSLGATAYLALSGRRPYDVTSFEAAAAAFKVPTRSLLEQLPDLPVELDNLILMLLQIDPARRPASAADVIERLNVIGGFSEPRDSEFPVGHFSSPALIGRSREMQELRDYVAGAMLRRGTALAIEGAPRMGRSRLAHELILEARLIGSVAVLVDGAGDACEQLVRCLVDALPQAAPTCLAAEPLVAALLEGTSTTADSTAASSPREASGALQAAVVRWVEAMSEHAVLTVVTDDAHALDAVSAGVVFGLAHGIATRRILLALTVSTGSGLHPTIERTLQICSRIKLRALSSEAVDSLVTSIFGNVPHRARFARWVEAIGGGNPAHSLDLMAALVRRRIVKRMSGSWALPQELPHDQLPASVEEALAGVLADLDADALELARRIAVQRSSAPLALCCELMKSRTEPEVLSLCDTLLADRVVSFGQTGYRIAHEGYHQALLAPLDEAQLGRLHRAVGEALLAHAGYTGDAAAMADRAQSAEAARTCLQAGWHLLQSGDGERGRELLRIMGIKLTRYGEGLADAVPALENAVAAFAEDQRSHYERVALMAPLTLAGTLIDPRLSYRYGEPFMDTLAEATGMDAATRLARVLPERLALYVALVFAVLRMRFTNRRLVARDFKEAMLALVGLASAVLGTYASLGDAATAERLHARLQPLGWFPPDHPATIAYRFQTALVDLAAGRYATCLQRAREILRWLLRPNPAGTIPEDAKRQFLIGLHIVVGSIDVYRTDDRIQESIRALVESGTPVALESAAGLRANYHAGRGEIREYQAAREELDVLAAQGGSPWRQDVLMPRCTWWIEAQCEDALSLKRSVRQLDAISRKSGSLASTHAAAHACYLADRGLVAEALTCYEPLLEQAVKQPSVLAARLVGAYARVLRQAGQPQRAHDLCRDALARYTGEERELSCLVHGVELELGRALASTGDSAGAAEHFDALCKAQDAHDNPLLHVLSHVGRAEVAVVQVDELAFTEHITKAERWATPTQYAPLFGLIQRLRARARAMGLESHVVQPASPWNTELASVTHRIAACRGAAERQQLALDMLIEHARAAGGYLYVVERAGLRLAAPLHGQEPSDALQAELELRVRGWHQVDTDATTVEECDALQTRVEDGGVDQDPISGFEAKVGSAYRIVFLSVRQRGAAHLVGVAALVEGVHPIRAIARPILESIANGLYRTGDATVLR